MPKSSTVRLLKATYEMKVCNLHGVDRIGHVAVEIDDGVLRVVDVYDEKTKESICVLGSELQAIVEEIRSSMKH